MNIVLIGFMGSGKSKIGRLLAKRLGWAHVDTDERVAAKVGRPVGAYIREEGEALFREQERLVVREAALLDRTVISTGGGVPMNEENMIDLKKKGVLVWLRIRPDTVLKRSGDFRSRPLIDPSDPLASVTARLQDRIPFYAKADHILDTDAMEPDEVVNQLALQFQNS